MKLLIFFLLLSLSFALDRESIRRQTLELIPHMADLRTFPLFLDGEKVKAWILEDKYPEGKLYMNSAPLDVEPLIANANVEEIPQRVQTRYGITFRRTDLKLLPTNAVIHKGNPDIDYNQYTALDPFVPLAILHHSKDKNWLYVQSPIMRGWVKKEDVRLIDREELLRVLDLPFLLVVEPELRIESLSYSMGAKVPYVGKEGEDFLVLMPDERVVRVKGKGLIEGFWEFSEERVKYLLDSLLGYPYQWGGYYDCSALVRALFGVFGLELPRNSYQQALLGEGFERRFNSYQELKRELRNLPPYRTLLYMKGHIMLFGGFEGEDVVIYHAVYSIKDDNGRKLYPKAVVKNLLERDGLKGLYIRILAVKVLK
ncbi:SH3 domain-containing protein [Thermocrinis sp.]